MAYNWQTDPNNPNSQYYPIYKAGLWNNNLSPEENMANYKKSLSTATPSTTANPIVATNSSIAQPVNESRYQPATGGIGSALQNALNSFQAPVNVEEKYQPYSSTAPQNTRDLFNKIYGGKDTGYLPTFNRAFENLNQPGEEKQGTPQYQDRVNISNRSTQILAEKFIDNYFKKYNALPNEDHIRDFVAGNLTSNFAQKMIQGGIPEDQLNQMTRQYISDNAPDIAPQGTQTASPDDSIQANLAKRIEELYGQQRGALSEQVDTEFGKQKQNVVNDLAAQGFLNQPTSRLTLNQLEDAKNRSLTQGLSALSGQQALGGQNLANTIASLGQRQSEVSQQARQFGQDLGLRRQAFSAGLDEQDYQRSLARQQLGLAQRLGQLQAGNRPSKVGRGLTGAASGAASGALAGSVVPGLGTGLGALFGGLAGGLGGYFSD